MEDTNPFEVREEDFKELEDIFRNTLITINTFVSLDTILKEELEDFIVDVGLSVKTILQKYSNDNQVKALEVKQYQEEVMKYKHRDVN